MLTDRWLHFDLEVVQVIHIDSFIMVMPCNLHFAVSILLFVQMLGQIVEI
jgi:hypothetical protein